MNDDERQSRLQAKYTEIAVLAGGLAHEIKNPLSTMSLNLQLLAEDVGEPETQNQRRMMQKIDVAQRECKRLESILNDFLRYARVQELRLEPTDLNALVREAAEFVGPQAKTSGVVVRVDPHQLPPVAVDRALLRQALDNLALNAVQAMSTGGELILSTGVRGGRVVIDVIDTGPGMSAETVANLYKPFRSTKKGGTGLGLCTAKKIVESHDGAIEVESEPGKGSRFSVVFHPN